ncbi:MAG: hypothetical protein WCP85_24560 [Mariniphaga sp.]
MLLATGNWRLVLILLGIDWSSQSKMENEERNMEKEEWKKQTEEGKWKTNLRFRYAT